MTDIHEHSIYTRNIYQDAAKRAKAGDLIRVPLLDILEGMAIDYLAPGGSRGSEFPAIVRAKIDYKEKKVEYIEDAAGSKEAHQKAQKKELAKMDFAEFLPNIDPFHSTEEDQQRILNAGFIKDYEKKIMLLLETPQFYSPTVDDLGRNAWLQCLTKMPMPKLKKDRKIKIGEIIFITFKNLQNFDGPIFRRFPVENAPVFDERFSFSQKKKQSSEKNKMATVKKVNTSKKCDQELLKKLEETGALYNEHLGWWRIRPNLNDFKGQVVAQGEDNAAVIAIENHPEYGKDGGDFSSRVSIVAGLQGHVLHECSLVEEVTPIADAAGVYITQRGDTQTPWNLVSPIGQHSEKWDYGESKKMKGTGKGSYYRGLSDVTLFADTIQLVARGGGVNIYGGGVGSTLSSGTPNETFVGVNLIAGNRIDDHDPQKTLDDSNQYQIPAYSLQPLVKGHSLQRYLNRLIRKLQKQNSKDFSGEMKNTITEITDVAALFGGFFSAGAGVIKAGTLVAKVPLIINSLGESVTGMYNSTVAEINTSAAFSESYLSKHNKTN